MPNACPLPVEFAALAEKIDYVQRKNDNEYTSSCPECGGSVHEDGDWPDRFVMWISNRYGNPFGQCLRGCGHKWSPTKQDAPWTPEEREEFVRKRIELQAAHDRQIETKLAELSAKIMDEKYYMDYHDRGMENSTALVYWEMRRIPESWQRHLFLGCIEDYKVTGRLSTYRSIAYTMPVFSHIGGRIENIKIRVGNPKDSSDRFRNYYKSGCQHFHNPQYTTPPARHVLLGEGETKADTMAIAGGLDYREITIYGAQSKQPEERLLKSLESFDAVYIAFDPDAYVRQPYYDQKTGEQKFKPIPVLEVAKKVGVDRARLVLPPRGMKFDDAINQGYNFANAVRMAIKPERLER